MSMYDDVSAQFQPAPPYPSRSGFTAWFGYAKGENLGKFISASIAKENGAITVEKVFDEAAFNAAKETYHNWSQRVAIE